MVQHLRCFQGRVTIRVETRVQPPVRHATTPVERRVQPPVRHAGIRALLQDVHPAVTLCQRRVLTRVRHVTIRVETPALLPLAHVKCQ